MAQPFPVPDDLAAQGIELMPDGLVAAVGADGVVALMNAPAERITGLAAADVVGRDIREALPLQDLDGASWWELTDPWHGRTGVGSAAEDRVRPVEEGDDVVAGAERDPVVEAGQPGHHDVGPGPRLEA